MFITSTHLPPWLTLVNNILLGVPDETAETTEIRLTAFTLPGGRGRKHRGRAPPPPEPGCLRESH